jgi:prepilin-type N-terminal cleavage/methylation domain-containing protein
MTSIRMRSLRRSGFTLIEVMLVLAIIGCLSVLCIPLFQRFAARSRKAELHNVLGKMELAFRNNYEATGSYGNFLLTPGASPDVDAEWNPSTPAGDGAAWTNSASYKTFPFPPDGALHLRYKYTVSNNGRTLTLQAKGSFMGIPDPPGWTYIQTFEGGAAPLAATEIPSL